MYSDVIQFVETIWVLKKSLSNCSDYNRIQKWIILSVNICITVVCCVIVLLYSVGSISTNVKWDLCKTVDRSWYFELFFLLCLFYFSCCITFLLLTVCQFNCSSEVSQPIRLTDGEWKKKKREKKRWNVQKKQR